MTNYHKYIKQKLMDFVCESLDRFMMLNEDFLAENILNEKLDINLIKNYGKKIGILTSMFFMFAANKSPEYLENIPSREEISKNPLILKMASDNYLSKDEILLDFSKLISDFIPNDIEILKITPEIVDSLNAAQPERFSYEKIDRYNRYDEDIIQAAKDLRMRGENPDPNLIKSVMLIETGMNPTKNYLGFEGFPQTKEIYINSINKKFHTNFTLEDMYDPYESAKFIHYFLKALKKSRHVNNDADMIISYNWGVGNLSKYKAGEIEEIPNQSIDYVKMIEIIKNYFV